MAKTVETASQPSPKNVLTNKMRLMFKGLIVIGFIASIIGAAGLAVLLGEFLPPPIPDIPPVETLDGD